MRNWIWYIGFIFTFCSVQAQQLQDFIQEAEANHPEIAAYQLRYEIAQEKVEGSKWLPNTQFSAGYFVSEPETRTGPQRARFSVRQMLPWFGTISARETYQNALADTEFVNIAIVKRKLGLSVAHSYYELYSIVARKDAFEENIELLKVYEQLALSSLEVGNASAVDVLRLQMRINELNEKYEVLNEMLISEKKAFVKLLNRTSYNDAIEVIPLQIPEQDVVFEGIDFDLHPELVKYDKLYTSVVQSEELNQKESAPQWGIGVDYIPVSERTDLSFSDNGKDVFIPSISLSIPVFTKKHKSKTRENELKQQEIEKRKEDRVNVLETSYIRAVSKRRQARIRYETMNKNLEQTQNAKDILIKSYETGTIDFVDILDVQELELKFKIQQIQAVKDYFKQSANINYLSNSYNKPQQ